MQNPKFSIPVELQGQLRYVEASDTRSDDEIFKSLTQYISVTSEKNIWAFWDSGFSNVPAWCQRNVLNWVRLCSPSWTVRVLDSVSKSPNYALKYVPTESLPECFVKGTMDGEYVGQHSADFLRGACLYLHGGIWLDVGIILIRDIERICWKKILDPESPFQVAVAWGNGTNVGNYFVSTRKHDPFIKRWHELFLYLWAPRTNHTDLADHPLLSFALDPEASTSRSDNNKFDFDFKCDLRTFLGYVAQVTAWSRLCMLEDAGDGFSCTEYWQNHVLCMDAVEEHWAAESIIGFNGTGQKLMDLLSCPLDADPGSQRYQEASKVVWRLLTKSSLQKVVHGKNLLAAPSIGTLWSLPENEGKDAVEGSFAELLRYGSVHFEQIREEVKCVVAPKPAKTMRKGVLEP